MRVRLVFTLKGSGEGKGGSGEREREREREREITYVIVPADSPTYLPFKF